MSGCGMTCTRGTTRTTNPQEVFRPKSLTPRKVRAKALLRVRCAGCKKLLRRIYSVLRRGRSVRSLTGRQQRLRNVDTVPRRTILNPGSVNGTVLTAIIDSPLAYRFSCQRYQLTDPTSFQSCQATEGVEEAMRRLSPRRDNMRLFTMTTGRDQGLQIAEPIHPQDDAVLLTVKLEEIAMFLCLK